MSYPERATTAQVLWRIVTLRTRDMPLSDFVGGCYLLIAGALGVVFVGLVAWLAVWLGSHLRWVS